MPYKLVPGKSILVSFIDINNPVSDTACAVGTMTVKLPPRKKWFDDNEFYSHLRELTNMKQRTQTAQKKKGKYEPSSDPLLSKYPAIQEYLENCWFENGSPRETSNIRINSTGSGVQLILNDPTERCSAFTSAPTLEDALELLEAALGGENDPWRPWPKSFGRKSS